MITNAVLTMSLSALTALGTIVVTNFLTRRREHEADWRKLKLAQYQQLIVAFSATEKSRYTPETVRQFTDAVNAMALIASPPVLHALQLYLTANAYNNAARTEAECSRLFSLLIHALRADIQPPHHSDDPKFQFTLLALPPETQPNDKRN